jgi:hypothetical protein
MFSSGVTPGFFLFFLNLVDTCNIRLSRHIIIINSYPQIIEVGKACSKIRLKQKH